VPGPKTIEQDAMRRLDRLEDALADLATLVAEGSVARPSLVVGPEGKGAQERFMDFLEAIRLEREP